MVNHGRLEHSFKRVPQQAEIKEPLLFADKYKTNNDDIYQGI